MERKLWVAFCILLLQKLATSAPSESNSLVVSSTESTKETKESENPTVNPLVNPQIYSMQINANISNRFAKTLITSKVRNVYKNASETTFSVILPHNAFISAFEMEIGGKVYKAYVKEKEEAKKIYQEAVSHGQSAAHVELSARDSKTFTVSVNIEPESKTIFRLVYEELLQRQDGQYELVVNIHPGQIVEDLDVQVNINESRPLTFVRTPNLRTGNEINKNDEKLNPSAEIEIVNSTSATVKFAPDVNEQKEFATRLKTKKENGLAGQFVVQYDVERDPRGGEVLVRDGYFVHFFAPTELEPLPKHVVFVLDHSGSMSGRSIYQLIDAMKNILSELKTVDLFNIVRFADEASVWSLEENKFVPVSVTSPNYGNLEPHLRELNLPGAVQATSDNIEKAKIVVDDQSDMGLTNMIAGLEVGLFLIKRSQEKSPNGYQPMIIFLTDGLPNVGLSSREGITETVTKLNPGPNRAVIFSLSFGSGADKKFLRDLSSHNLGFSRHIYGASDASLQLQDFYKKISSPLLTNVTFKYMDGVTDVTKTQHPIFFNGSEIVVTGRISNHENFLIGVNGICTSGHVTFNASRTEPVSSLERLWAYLTVKQILKERDSATNKTELTKKALDLALKYSFVTPVSSLVVVKPNKTDSVDSKPIDEAQLERTRSSQARLYGGPITPHFRSRSGKTLSMHRPLPRLGGAGGGYPSFSSAIYRPGRRLISPRRHYGLYDLDAFDHSGPLDSGRVNNGIMKLHSSKAPQKLSTTPAPSSKNTTIPQWLEDLKNRNQNITTPQGTFKLGKSGDVATGPYCLKTPTNTTGSCTLIFDCPQVFSLVTDFNIYLKYFCPLNEYAGICCPIVSN